MTDELKQYLISNFGKYSFKQVVDTYGVTVEEIQEVLRAKKGKKCLYKDRCYESKLEIAEYYKTHSEFMTAKYFVIPSYTIKEVAKEFNIKPLSRSEALAATKIANFGSIEAANEHMLEATKNTSRERYGVDNPAQAQSSRDKQKETFQRKYGVDNIMQSGAGKERFKKSCREHLGVDWPMQHKAVLEKRTVGNQHRYGGDGWGSDVIYKNYQNTVKERYGVDNPMKSNIVKARLSDVVKERYGVDWFCMHPDARSHSKNDSVPNRRFEELLIANSINYTREFNIGHFSYDFKIGNNLVEINPTPTHNINWTPYNHQEGLKYTYHQEKTQLAEDNGYRVIHVWDWDSQEKVVSILRSRERVYARNCTANNVSRDDAKEFIEAHHLQGNARFSVAVGLYLNNQLVSVMTFDKPRYNKNAEMELVRYCSSYNVVGGAEKLFKYFIDSSNVTSVVSYCDHSKFDGKTYIKLGFTKIAEAPSKHWYNMKTKKHITDNLLRQRGFDQLFGTNYGRGTNNEELMRQAGFDEVIDAGQITFLWKS